MSSAPMRLSAGFTQDQSWQPLGLMGAPNPFFYALFHDDFLGYQAGKYTVTTTGNGTIVQTDGADGRILYTTNSTTPATTDIASLQVDSACMLLGINNKAAYLARFQVADILNPAFLAGMIQKTVTPFTVTDGIYFSKASGSTDIVCNVMAASAVIGTATLSGLLTANTDIDLGWQYDGRGNVLFYAGASLIGQKSNQNTANLGPMARIAVTSVTSTLLTPTLALESGTATSKTLNADFLLGSVER